MNMKKINCLFLRNCTIEPLEDSLIEYLKKFNIDIKPFFSDYDNIVQASLDENFIKKKLMLLLFCYGYQIFQIF